MLKRTIAYTNFDGEDVEGVFYFNLSESELTRLDVRYERGLDKFIEMIVEAKDNKALYDLFEEIIFMSYGKKSEDGSRFIKSDELSEEFKQHAAYNKLLMEFIQDSEAAADFIMAVVPQSLSKQITEELQSQAAKAEKSDPPKPPGQ